MDRRQEKTRQAVFTAFTALLEKKTYANISVQEIIDAANIGRSTFYSHFETKDDLLRALCAEIFDHVFHEDSIGENQSDLQHTVTHFLSHIRKSGKTVRGIISGESGDIFMQYFREHLGKVFTSELAVTGTDVPEDYIMNFLVCSLADTVRWWLRNERYTPEEICRFYFQSVQGAGFLCTADTAGGQNSACSDVDAQRF